MPPLASSTSARSTTTPSDLRRLRPGAEQLPPGLKGVVVAKTGIGDVRGSEGFFHYRQYSGIELSKTRSFEDVWQLLIDGSLPVDRAAQQAFATETRALRSLSETVRSVLPHIVAVAGPLDSLRTALSLVAAERTLRPVIDIDPAARRSDALFMAAITPTLVAACHRLASGQETLEPRGDLGHVANYLWMLTGNEPTPRIVSAVERYLIATIDHGFNASTFTARVIASTGADIGAGVLGALGALSGPLHGGAPSRALDLLDEIGTPDRARAVVADKLRAGKRIMGFGHAVYRTEDPRSAMLREIARDLGGPLVELALAVEQVVVEELANAKPGRRLYANIEYYAGVVLTRCGIPPSLFTPTFTMSRIVGWTANILEQARDSKIIRPSARYVGPPPPQPVPSLD